MIFSLDHFMLLFAGATATIYLTRGSQLARLAAAALWIAVLTVKLPRFTVFDVLVGAIGSMSALSMATCAAFVLVKTGVPPPERSEALFVARAVAVLGAMLYLHAFGFWMFDAYRLGFTPAYLAVLAVPFLAVAIHRKWVWSPACLLAVIAAYGLKLLPSVNWWDYLIDPLLWVCSFIAMIVAARAIKHEAATATGAAGT